MKTRHLMLTGLCLAGALLTGTAMARGNDDVEWSVTIGGGSPVYGRPAPVYVQPAYPAYEVYPAYNTYNNYRAPRHGGNYQHPRHWDRDGDGVPNRYDRVYNPVWDRDGDGVPNRYDRVYNPAWDRDGDGIPNRHDRQPDRPGRGH